MLKVKSRRLSNCPILETERLILRPIELSDDEALFALRSNLSVIEFMGIKPYKKISHAYKFIKIVIKDIERHEAFYWGVVNKNEVNLIGTVCLWNFNWDLQRAEIGFELHPNFQNKGFMREAVLNVIDFARKVDFIKYIDAITHEDNLASIALLKRFSFEKLGLVKDMIPEIDEGPEMLLYRLTI